MFRKESADGSYLLFTVPYDRGWNVRIDGVATETVAAFDTLLAVPLSAGTHTITFSYFPTGFGAGILITILSAAAGLLYIFFTRKRALR